LQPKLKDFIESFSNVIEIPKQISLNISNDENNFLKTNYLEVELDFLKDKVARIKSQNIYYLNIYSNNIHALKNEIYFSGNGKISFHQYKCHSSYIYINKNITHPVNQKYFFIKTSKETFKEIINSKIISYADISIIPDYLLKLDNKKLFFLLLSYFARKFTPNISYNDLLSNADAIDFSSILKTEG
tara:strand:- start:17259 stop:17819 length:561 start_codon:yes stop_codon:yes gene_type:complete